MFVYIFSETSILIDENNDGCTNTDGVKQKTYRRCQLSIGSGSVEEITENNASVSLTVSIVGGCKFVGVVNSWILFFLHNIHPPK